MQIGLMEKVADKALKEHSWKEIEEMFKPSTMAELLLRLDFEGAKNVLTDWTTDDAPDAMPFRFRPPYSAKIWRIIEMEELYRIIKDRYELALTL